MGRGDNSLLIKEAQLAKELINSDPLSSLGYWERSIALQYLGEFEQALSHIEFALTLSPHNPNIVARYADILCHCGQTTKARTNIELAFSLIPIPPDEFYWIKAGILFLQENYQAALDGFQRTSYLTPRNYRMILACHAMLKNNREAAEACNAQLEEYPDFSVSEWENSFPLKKVQDIQHYAKAMRQAGFN